MGRRISTENQLGVVATWAAVLKPWAAQGKPGDVRRLAALLGIEIPQTGKRAKSFQLTVTELRAAIDANDDVDASLHQWITRHLVTDGPDLLIPESHRVSLLEKQRDAARRARNQARGKIARTIQMPARIWSRLDKVKHEMDMKSRDEALVAVIVGFNLKRSVSKSKLKATPSKPGFGERDLFAPAEPPPPSSRGHRGNRTD